MPKNLVGMASYAKFHSWPNNQKRGSQTFSYTQALKHFIKHTFIPQKLLKRCVLPKQKNISRKGKSRESVNSGSNTEKKA